MPSAAPPIIPAPVPVSDWSGVYVGLEGGYGWGHQKTDAAFPFQTPNDITCTDPEGPQECEQSDRASLRDGLEAIHDPASLTPKADITKLFQYPSLSRYDAPAVGGVHETARVHQTSWRGGDGLAVLYGSCAANAVSRLPEQRLAGHYRFNADSFREGLTKAGFIESRNVRIEERCARGDYEALPALAAELVAKGVVVIAATGDMSLLHAPPSVRAAQCPWSLRSVATPSALDWSKV